MKKLLKQIQKFIFKYILGINRSIPWNVHFTSQIVDWENISFPNGMGEHHPGDCIGNYIQARNGIVFGYDVRIGQNVNIISANHDLKDFTKHVNADPIRIDAKVWVGAGSTILPGVHLAEGIVVGAGSVVTKSFEEKNIVIAGNPAKKIKEIS